MNFFLFFAIIVLSCATLLRAENLRSEAINEEAIADKCALCKNALGTYWQSLKANDLASSCNRYASIAADFTQCRFVWTTRLDKIKNLITSGCNNSQGTTIKPCPLDAVCNALVAYGSTSSRYCPPPSGYGTLPGIPM